MGKAVFGIFVRSVEDLPIDEFSVPRDADRTRTDPAEGKRNVLRIFALIDHFLVLSFLL